MLWNKKEGMSGQKRYPSRSVGNRTSLNCWASLWNCRWQCLMFTHGNSGQTGWPKKMTAVFGLPSFIYTSDQSGQWNQEKYSWWLCSRKSEVPHVEPHPLWNFLGMVWFETDPPHTAHGPLQCLFHDLGKCTKGKLIWMTVSHLVG